jgi:hypothetical protein
MDDPSIAAVIFVLGMMASGAVVVAGAFITMMGMNMNQGKGTVL